jgi:rare lipoprotein A
MRKAAADLEPTGPGAVGPRPALTVMIGGMLLLAACAGPPTGRASGGRVWDPVLGVWSSPRLVADGDPVPRGGGTYLTGRPYTIGGRLYVPSQNPTGYSAVGMASWYGDAFHGRRTANGEIFDKGSISAAHPTLPLPSYVRVTNTTNGRSIVVRVNDRGPYHGGRVMDVSQRVADALAFRGAGTARVKIDYLGRAPIEGSDDNRLLATLRTDGSLAQMNGMPQQSPAVAESTDGGQGAVAADAIAPMPDSDASDGLLGVLRARNRRMAVPLPPARPFDLSRNDTAGAARAIPALLATRDSVESH